MRKILMLTLVRVAAVPTVVHLARSAAYGAILVTGLWCQSASAQYPTSVTGSMSDASSNSAIFAEVPHEGSVLQTASGPITGSVQPAQYRPGQALSSSLFGGGISSSDPCSSGCDISWYLGYDALWLRREGDERFSLTRNTILPDFDYEFGGRYTVGRLLDCVNAWEAVYVGPYEWQRAGTVNGAANVRSNFFPSGGFDGTDITTFNNANSHTQLWTAELNSFELNRRWWTWDVLSTMIGIRYVDYEENFTLATTSPAGNGFFTERVDNSMVGVQVGGDLMYPVNLRTTVGFRGKAGAFANFAENSTIMRNAGTLLLNTGDDDVDIAGVIEGGIFGHYHLVPSIRLTAGYEFWYLPGSATIPEQSPSSLTPVSGSTVVQEDDLFLHGGSVGVQVLY